MTEEGAQQRLSQRIVLEVGLRYLVPLETFDRVHTATTCDIGHGGLVLEVDSSIREGTDLILELRPRDCGVDQELIRLQGNCIWCVSREGKHRVGIMFNSFDDHLRARVSRFLDGLHHLAFLTS